MIDSVFSPSLCNQLLSSLPVDLDNIDHELSELVVAGISALGKKNIIYVVGENESFAQIEEKLHWWLDFLQSQASVYFYLFPIEDPYVNNKISERSLAGKLALLSGLQRQEKAIIVTTLSALNIKIESSRNWNGFYKPIHQGMTLNRRELIEEMIGKGFQMRDMVEEPGDISWRGSIVDLFPFNSEHPWRFEIEGGQVESIRSFDIDTQKSKQIVEQIVIPLAAYFLDFPEAEQYFLNCHSLTGMDYLPFVLGEYRMVIQQKEKRLAEYQKLLAHFRRIYSLTKKTVEPVIPVEKIFSLNLADFNYLNITGSYSDINQKTEWQVWRRGIADFKSEDIDQVKDLAEQRGFRVYLDNQRSGLFDMARDWWGDKVYPCKPIPYPFENSTTRSLFLTWRAYRFYEKIDYKTAMPLETDLEKIQIHDYVVHQTHGIGRFVGFETIGLLGQTSEYLKLEFFNREFLYVPLYEVNVISKYAGSEGFVPPLDKMGGKTWKVKQKRAQKSMVSFAGELLELYAKRKAISGQSYRFVGEWEDRLQQDFPYVETEDQKQAIKDTMTDLEADCPMDRLICGDVSFGKTEVALRAALRVVSHGRQVAILCPTTILAYQHYQTFTTRLREFPIRLAMLSRMISQKERVKLSKSIKEGKIDIIIGTHALLGHGIDFANLGLYIIDEEQRFGVFQKEKIKKMNPDVDVLSLSATPIPRTLSLSLAGLQDISTIQSPPIGRMAVKNHVAIFKREVIVSAILNEIERDGLVFVVFNNIKKIFAFAEQLKKWCPDVPITVIHAQMPSHQIEKKMWAFINKEFRLLVSTTLIENGIDIPDVNTMIVVNAQNFGLTQLYQLRGRIGRGSKQAYAYFLFAASMLSDKASARLQAIKEFAALGSGYRLAEFDLKLRGAGSLLGGKQHGHVDALGFDYYQQLLLRTIRELKGEKLEEMEVKIQIHFSYSIDKSYIANTAERLKIYKQILNLNKKDEINELRLSLIDRYGHIPESMEKIFFAGIVRLLARQNQCFEVEVFLDRMIFRFYRAKMDGLKRLEDGLKIFSIKKTGESEITVFFGHYLSFLEQFYRQLDF